MLKKMKIAANIHNGFKLKTQQFHPKIMQENATPNSSI
jgi:hypothetical protein